MVACGSKNEPIRVLYASTLVSAETYSALFSRAAAVKPSLAAQKYHLLMTQGLSQNGAQVLALCLPPIARQTSARRFLRLEQKEENGVLFHYLPVVALPGVKQLLAFCEAFFFSLRYLKKKDSAVCDGLNIALSAGVRLASSLKKCPCIAIVTDVPEILAGGKTRTAAFNAHLLAKFNGYVLLTEAMNALVNPKNKPYLVAEGQVDARMNARENTLAQKHPELVCLYAGMLHAKYGVVALAEAFSRVQNYAARLVFYGQGDAEARLYELARADARIELRGVADNETVVSEELKATLLINPRPSGEEFTAYSFPSKNLEYMASGTPVLTTRLSGMPREYDAYAYLLADESVDGMAKTLTELLALPRETLHAKGRIAKEFVLSKKSNTAQAARLLAFLSALNTQNSEGDAQ